MVIKRLGEKFGNFALVPYFLQWHIKRTNLFGHFGENFTEPVKRTRYKGAKLLHDDASTHYRQSINAYLNTIFPNKWIRRMGPVRWPPRYYENGLVPMVLC